MRLIIILIISSAAVINITAQETDERSRMPLESRIGLALGLGSVTYLDTNTSPLIYSSRPKYVRLFYNLESNEILFTADIDFRLGGNSPKYPGARTLFFREEDYKGKTEDKKFDAGGTFLAGRVSMGFFYKIPSTQESTFKVAVGVRATDEMFYPQGWTSGGIFNALGLAPEAVTQHRADAKSSFTASVRIPVVALVTRLPYDNTVSRPGRTVLGGFFENTEWSWPDKFIAPSASMGYNFQISDRWGAGLNYEFTWYNIKRPQTMKAVSHTFQGIFHHQF
jgi:hypothetical protein